jgi:sugar (pentulose or hexulose) kinase
MVGGGVYGDVRKAAKALVKKSGEKHPNRKKSKTYREAGDRFRALYPSLKGFFQG